MNKDRKLLNFFRKKKADDWGYRKGYKCSKCGRSIPDRRYHGKCQDCYFNENDASNSVCI